MEKIIEMARVAYEALDEKKGEDIHILDISQISILADYFIIANGTSISQVAALVDNVDNKMEKEGYQIKHQEGQKGGNWILLDYGDIIVHVFDKEGRAFYNLERIWNDGKRIEL